MPGIRVEGVRLHVEERGTGPPILCIHGTGSSSALWSRAVEALASRGRAIAYDRRGFSRSGGAGPLAGGVRRHADAAAALLDALRAAPAIIVGRSQGGEIAVDMALRYPDRVRALALLEGGGLALSPALREWLAGIDRRVFAAAEADVGTVGETLLRAVLGDAGWDGLPEAVRRVFAENGPAIVAEERGGVLDVTEEQLATIRRPALVVAAADSPPPLADAMRRLDSALPESRLEWVAGDHLIDPAHPVVTAFIDEVLAAA